MNFDTIAVPRNSCPNCGKPCFLPIHLKKHEVPPISLENSNRIPDEDEESSLRKSLKDVADEVAILDGEIGRLGDMMRRLKKRRDEAMAYANRQRAILSPIRRIPMDILAEIFHEYMELEEYGIPLWAPSKIANIWTLAGVRNSWRIAIHSTPKLWSKFITDSYHFNIHHNVSEKQALKHLQSCLTWTKETPLSLSFHPRQSTDCLWNRLVSERHRWEKVDLNGSGNAARLMIPTGKFPLLRSLVLRYFNEENRAIDIFEDSPQLRTVHISHHSACKWRLPWSQLHHLSLANSSFELFTLLAQMPNLTSFSWFNSLTPGFEGSQPIPLLRLRTLTCHLYGFFDYPLTGLQTFLSAISTPQLKSLSFYDHSTITGIKSRMIHNPLRLVDAILQFCERCSCSLTKLHTTSRGLELAPALKLFNGTSDLTELELMLELPNAFAILPPLFSSIRDNDRFLPRLQKLRIEARASCIPTFVQELIPLLNFKPGKVLRIDVINKEFVSEITYRLVEQFNAKEGNTIKLNLMRRY